MRPLTLLWKLSIAAAVIAGASGCAPKIEPEIASAASEPTYAEDYPAELQRTMEDINAAEAKTKEISAKFGSYGDALKSPPWAKVVEVADLADASGRAYAFVEAKRENDAARAFFEAEKDEILKKVAGAAQYTAKQKGCDADVSGAVQHSLKETVEKRLDKRLHDASEAQLYIDRNATALGKDNVDKLGEQADEITQASYLVHVAIVEDKVRVRRMIEEGETIKKTLDAGLRAETAYQGESGRTPAEKKASEERAEAMRKATASIDAALTQARSVSERADERVLAVQKVYGDAMAKLRADLKKRAGQ